MEEEEKKIHVCLSGEGGTSRVFVLLSATNKTTLTTTTLLRLLFDEEETSLKPHLFPSSPGWRRTTRRRVSERGERHRL